MSSVTTFRRKLLAWFKGNGRRLPWRTTRDPYAIVVSEVMLQQTQVDRVIPKYKNWLTAFPNWNALDRAPQSRVLALWSGLGYNRRALMLQRLAKTVASSAEGFPKTSEDMQKLPGIGPYTAQAVSAFAFKTPKAAPVDTNIERIIRRVFGLYDASAKDIVAAARSLVPRDVWTWNHAMMDFGALMCTARKPKCATCPMRPICAAYPCPGNDSKKPKQKKFIGSDRMYRGRILRALQADPLMRQVDLMTQVGLASDQMRFKRIIDNLAREGFVETNKKDEVKIAS